MSRVEIIEVLSRADQGVKRSLICKGNDGNIYFAKGKVPVAAVCKPT